MPLSIDKGQLGMSAVEKLQLLKKQLLEKANRDSAVYPLSYGQRALYFLYVNSPESPAYNVSFSARIVSSLNVEALKKSIQKLVNRHSSLRTNYKLEDGKPVQVVHGYQEVSFTRIDVSELDENSLRNLVIEKSREPFDLENGKVLRVYLFSKSENDNVLLICIHHISTDGRSVEVMMEELGKLYESEASGKSDSLLPSEKHYHEFISAQEEFVNSDKAKSQLEYWTNELSGEQTDLDLPNDRPRPPMQTFNGSTVYFELDADLVDKLKQVSKDSGATLFAFMLSCYILFLRKHSDNTDISAGIAAAGRSFPGFENMMGYFINPVTIKTQIADEMTFDELLSITKRKVLHAVDNQDLPFQLVVEKLMHGRDASRSPVFQTFFGLQRIQGDDSIQELIVPGNESANVDWAGLKLRPYQISQQEGQFDITAEFAEGKDVFSGAFKYNTDLFDKSTVEKMAEHFLNLLRQIAENKSKAISEYHLITESEKKLILNDWNNTDLELSGIDFIDRMFDKAAKDNPSNPALEFNSRSISYSELSERSDRLSAALRNKGLSRGDLAAICLERSFEMVIAMLAVLKAGGAYVPVDPDYPDDRIRFMLKDSAAKVLITQNKFKHFAVDTSSVILAEDFNSIETGNASSDNALERSIDDCAYVIYTSGSTGTPKGVAISHRALANHMLWMKDISEFSDKDCVLQKTPYSFDASVWEFYLPLLNGGKLVIAKPDGHMDTNYLVNLVNEAGVTHIQFVPSLLRLFMDEPDINSCKSLKFIFSGGEALTADLRDKVFDNLDTRLVNLYGPTEATIDSVFYECRRDYRTSIIPIGRPIYNMKAFVADNKLNLLPPGIAGELLLGGDGIAIGYLNNPELTSEKFVEDSITNCKGKLYRTGDKVKFNPNGELEYLGRIDHQVKFRGFRIELSEIETALKKFEGVRDAYVDLRKDAAGRDVLVAYLVSSATNDEHISNTKASLKRFFPEYMIPGHFIVLDEFPHLPNGKIDRKKLPDPVVQDRRSESFSKAKEPIEKTLVRIWEEVLGLNNIGINDNFFELGGDSIMSIQIISRAAREGIRITPRQIFSFQTIAELSKEADAKDLLLVKESPTGEVKFTPVQLRFLKSGMKNPSHFNHSVLIKVRKGLDAEVLNKALLTVVNYHDALRLKLTGKDSGTIPENTLPVGFAEFDFSGLNPESALDNLQKEKRRLNTLIDLYSGRLLNAACFRMPDANDRLLFNIHHFCIDGVSWRIFLNDFVHAYESIAAGSEILFQPKSTSFREWCMKLHEHSKSEEVEEKISLWNYIEAGEDKLLPDGAIIEKNIYSSAARFSITLTPEETAHLTGDANKAFNTSINDLLLSALAISYGRLTGKSKLQIDLEGHGRDDLFDDADISNTIGWFTSIYPVQLETQQTEDIPSVIKSVKETLNKITPVGINFGIFKYIKDDLIQSDILNKIQPNIVFNYLGQFRDEIAPGGWTFETDSLNLETGGDELRQHLIEINSMITSSRLVMNIEYSKNIHDEQFIKSFADQYLNALRDVLNHCMNADSVSFTASDFSDSGLNQQELDDLLTNLN